jgi:hypothetical protein
MEYLYVSSHICNESAICKNGIMPGPATPNCTQLSKYAREPWEVQENEKKMPASQQTFFQLLLQIITS